MRQFYTLLFYLALPFIVTRLLWRARKIPAYAHRLNERLGLFTAPLDLKQPLWIHAVSLGEVNAAIPLVQKLQQQFPTHTIVITTSTPTGSARVNAIFGDSIFHVYAPYDIPFAISHFFRRIQPLALIIIETELWPNWIAHCAKQTIPVCVANARLSERSARGYQHIPWIIRPLLQSLQLLLVQTTIESERFLTLGMPPERMVITGSLKFDITIPDTLFHQAALLRQIWGCHRPILIAASTHAGEDEIVLAAFSLIRAEIPNTLLILVPRHPNRFQDVMTLCQQEGFQTVKRSDPHANVDGAEVFVGDTMGELLLFYALADVAFIGGSLVPTGGHNPLEPAAVGTPCLTGPHTFNFHEIFHQLVQAGAASYIQDASTLAQAACALLQDKTRRQYAVEKGLSVIEQNRGALHKHCEQIAHLIKP